MNYHNPFTCVISGAYVKIILLPTEGRKNWLFCGNYDAAKNAAIIYSMLGYCKAKDVNFREWLIFFLNNIHKYDEDYSKDLAELLPHNFKSQNPNCNK